MSSHKVIASVLSEEALAHLRQHYIVSVRSLGFPISDEELRDTHAVVTTPYDRVNSEFLDRAPKLKIIAQFGVGTDNIDLESAKAKGVVVTHTPNVGAIATAELAISLLLLIARRFKESQKILDQGPEAMPLGFDLTGKNLGIIGLGQIGVAVARRAHAFGMKIFYFNRDRANPTIERETTASYRTWRKLLEISDVLTLHCDLNPDSYHLVNEEFLNCMKDGAILINTSRAEVIDETALDRALKSKKLWGAGLDVYSANLPESVHSHPRTILTPHSGTATISARTAMSNMVLDSIMACLKKDDKIPNRKI
ncbi:MAG: NAD(P)-binding domain-containing protein [Bacteroidetes bacterium]|nr:NAD(P)-binding domain-containing protein [Bacteroidota bacterium]MCY4204100.1 NAD(P)-binding domain-containing protein [Bacteroidota bacterium]